MNTNLSEAVVAGCDGEVLSGLPLPEKFPALTVHRSDVDMFDESIDKDVRRSLQIIQVPMPELAPDEVLVAVMASAINYNTVWSAMFEPISTFRFLQQFGQGRRLGGAARPALPRPRLGRVRRGRARSVRPYAAGRSATTWWSPRAYVDEQDPAATPTACWATSSAAWGFETNFGGLAHYAVARASQLLPKPAHLTWEEAACNPLCAGTAYRMLVSDRGARMKQGDVVLIWGAAGGLGAYAVQLVRNGGGIAVGVVSSPSKADVAAPARLRRGDQPRGIWSTGDEPPPRDRKAGASGSAYARPSARTRTSSSSTSAGPPSALGLRRAAAAGRWSRAVPAPATSTRSTTATSG